MSTSGNVIRMAAEELGAEDRGKIVKEVIDYIKSLEIFDEIIETRAGGVISSHRGPGTLGVLFISKQ